MTPAVACASATGSSPPSAAPTSGPSPADTTTTPRDVRPYPRERIAGRQPSKRSRRARSSTSGVLPVPPNVRLPTEIEGRGSACDTIFPEAYHPARSSTALP